jgi:uncharacterized membrane protein YGL010W
MSFLHRQMRAYASFHRDPINKATHAVGIPTIVLSVLVTVAIWAGGRALAILLVLYLVPILVMEPLVGAVLAVALSALAGAAMAIAAGHLGDPGRVASTAFVGGWALQFVGHLFEGRKPAFLENLGQLLVAPPFMAHELCVVLGLAEPLEPL